jgi:branched-chain amino acid aminotransferase
MSMADRDGFIWYDGKLVPWRDATTHVLTHSLHYGLAVFEGVRAYKTASGTAIFRLQGTYRPACSIRRISIACRCPTTRRP